MFIILWDIYKDLIYFLNKLKREVYRVVGVRIWYVFFSKMWLIWYVSKNSCKLNVILLNVGMCI